MRCKSKEDCSGKGPLQLVMGDLSKDKSWEEISTDTYPEQEKGKVIKCAAFDGAQTRDMRRIPLLAAR